MDKAQYLTEMHRAWSSCQGCMLCNSRQTVVFGYGNPDAQVLVVGEAPGFNEDIQGVPFVGQAGNLLDQYLSGVSTHPRLIEIGKSNQFPASEVRDILLTTTFYTNVVSCRPPDNRDPTPGEIKTCLPRLHEIIYTVDPVLIIGVGRIPVEVLLGRKVQITKDRGDIFDVQIPGRFGRDTDEPNSVTYPLLATLHTSYLLRQNDFSQPDGVGRKTYQDILHGMHVVDWFNWLHYDEALPKDRPKEQERDK